MTTTTANPVTDKQAAFIRSLLDGRTVDADTRAHIEAGIADRTMDRRDASAFIDYLKCQPRAVVPAQRNGEAPAPITPGIYEKDGVVYRIKEARESGNLYATVLVEIGGQRVTEAGTFINAEYQYAPGAIRTLTAADRMNAEQAEALTVRYGMCVVCARHLKDAKSVQRGMGPVCAGRV